MIALLFDLKIEQFCTILLRLDRNHQDFLCGVEIGDQMVVTQTLFLMLHKSNKSDQSIAAEAEVPVEWVAQARQGKVNKELPSGKVAAILKSIGLSVYEVEQVLSGAHNVAKLQERIEQRKREKKWPIV